LGDIWPYFYVLNESGLVHDSYNTDSSYEEENSYPIMYLH